MYKARLKPAPFNEVSKNTPSLVAGPPRCIPMSWPSFTFQQTPETFYFCSFFCFFSVFVFSFFVSVFFFLVILLLSTAKIRS